MEAIPIMDSIGRRRPLSNRGILSGIAIVAWALCLWGIQRELPYVPNIDEPLFVSRAVRIASTGDLNPGWFGNPASTTIYPLAAVYHWGQTASLRGTLLQPNSQLQSQFNANSAGFYLLGRYLMAIYFVLSVLLTFQIGQRIFGRAVGLGGAWLLAITPLAIGHAQLVRSDSPATFFGLLGLWSCLKVYDRPSARNQTLAGFSIGLAIASRYFMAALSPALLAIDILILKKRSEPRPAKSLLLAMAAGLLAIGIGFAASTPYFFLDFSTAWHDIQIEARTTHLGADGLSPVGNFLWYLTTALPLSMTWPVAILAGAGVLLIVRRRAPPQLWSVGFVALFMLGICLSPLHWQRWLIQILPMLALFAAEAIVVLVESIVTHAPSISWRRVPLGVAFIGLVSIWPLTNVSLADIQQSRPTTRLLARTWVIQNIPAGSKIAEEWYTAPLGGADFVVLEQNSLASAGTLDSFAHAGYSYLIASSSMYGRYFAEPERYATEVAFYRTLFAQERLLQQIEPSALNSGPEIRIYQLRAR